MLTLASHAAEFSVAWSTSGGGAGLSASADGRFSLNGTAGRPDGGPARGGRFTLEGGYWNSVLCAYGLTITRFVEEGIAGRPVFVTVSWPSSDLGDCVLETTTELHTDPSLNVWTPLAFRRAGEVNFYSTEAIGLARFFRLRQ